jgi:hypothetical protein
MEDIQFGERPPATNKRNDYADIADRLRQRPDTWAMVAVAEDMKDLRRWQAAMRFRGLKFSQRKRAEGGWAIWCKYESRP